MKIRHLAGAKALCMAALALVSTVIFGACSDSAGSASPMTGSGGAAGHAGNNATGGAGTSEDAGTAGSAGTTPGDSGAPVADAGLTADAVCTEYAGAVCAKLAQCASRVYLGYPTAEDCLLANKLDCQVGLTNPKWTPASQAACNAARSAAGCEAIYEPPAACVRPAGDKAVGTPCFHSDECVSGASCVAQPGRTSACGVCKMDAQVSQACGAGVQCAQGLRCDTTCYTPTKLGVACAAHAACAFPLVCGASGDLCHQAKPLGATCGPTIDDCDQYDGVHCNAGSHKCEAVLIAMNLGDHCGFDSTNGNTTICAGGLRCSGEDIKINLCNSAGHEGQACALDANGNDPCSVGLYCMGTCVRADKVSCK